ncbi:Uncharacterised protein [Brucella anthropi]|nr:hypothetical protein [Brucella anthropi]SUB56183.1 Uncharacterised protein [Brucella anthropi]
MVAIIKPPGIAEKNNIAIARATKLTVAQVEAAKARIKYRIRKSKNPLGPRDKTDVERRPEMTQAKRMGHLEIPPPLPVFVIQSGLCDLAGADDARAAWGSGIWTNVTSG